MVQHMGLCFWSLWVEKTGHSVFLPVAIKYESDTHTKNIKALSVLLCTFGSSTLQRILTWDIPFWFQCFISMLYGLKRTSFGQSNAWHQHTFLFISRFKVWYVGVFLQVCAGKLRSSLNSAWIKACVQMKGVRGQGVQNTVWCVHRLYWCRLFKVKWGFFLHDVTTNLWPDVLLSYVWKVMHKKVNWQCYSAFFVGRKKNWEG